VTYRVAPAERSGLDEASVDLVTVGQALHWFARKEFFEEVKRVGVAGGAVAVWVYDLFELPGKAGAVVRAFHDRMRSFWPPERALVISRYADIVFPFEEIPVPPVEMTAEWNLERSIGYLSTWSAVKAFQKATGEDPVAAVEPELAAAWGDPAAEKTVRWPLVVRAGRIG
jgi:hypothetical protein